VAAGSSLGPVPLHHLFLVGSQKSSQASAVTAGALDRPDPLAWVAACHLEQLLVAGWVVGTVAWVTTAPVAAATTAAVWVCWWVSTPTGELDDLCQHVHRVDSLPGRRRDGSDRTHGRTVTGHTRSPRVVRLLHQASSAGSGPLPATTGGQVRA